MIQANDEIYVQYVETLVKDMRPLNGSEPMLIKEYCQLLIEKILSAYYKKLSRFINKVKKEEAHFVDMQALTDKTFRLLNDLEDLKNESKIY